ncbi:hypothetical protein ACFY8O_07930 [Streptomyces argenteolus]|uniref:Uncharacterized protein n=1 Tax=Streptomyces argenteolus TaxID=67274 RepID=A0ABW6X191_9ACTN
MDEDEKGETALWRRAADLLPPDEAHAALDCRGIGEQEGALQLIVSGLLARGAPLGGTARAEISVLTEAWSVREELGPDLARCAGGPEDRTPPLELIGAADAAPLPGGSVGAEALEGLLVVPWITRTGCPGTLARAHRLEPWGDLSFLAEHYVLLLPGEPGRTRLFPSDAVFEALEELRGLPGRD